MSNSSSRRGFLIRAGAGAAVAGAAVVAAPTLASTPSARPSASREPMMIYVGDPSKGEVSVMVGERENVVVDHQLVSQLMKAAG